VDSEEAESGFPHKSQPVAAATELFLERSCAALRTVPTPTPSARAIARQEAPWVRRSATLWASTRFRGRPIPAPRARAATSQTGAHAFSGRSRPCPPSRSCGHLSPATTARECSLGALCILSAGRPWATEWLARSFGYGSGAIASRLALTRNRPSYSKSPVRWLVSRTTDLPHCTQRQRVTNKLHPYPSRAWASCGCTDWAQETGVAPSRVDPRRMGFGLGPGPRSLR
jgi:hypothetical protein